MSNEPIQVVITNNSDKLAAWNSLANVPFAGADGNRSVPNTVAPPAPPQNSAVVEVLKVLSSHAAMLDQIIASPDIRFLVNIASIMWGNHNKSNLPYFVADLFVLLLSWKNESYNPELIENEYSARLNGLLSKYHIATPTSKEISYDKRS